MMAPARLIASGGAPVRSVPVPEKRVQFGDRWHRSKRRIKKAGPFRFADESLKKHNQPVNLKATLVAYTFLLLGVLMRRHRAPT